MFETEPTTTKFTLRQEFTLPAGFFDVGSDPFRGVVHFKGVPLGVFIGPDGMLHDIGTADTIVFRTQTAVLPPTIPASATIPIELVALSLQSVAPIEVQVGGDTQVWDVLVGPSLAEASTGSMTITRTSDQGGTFSSTLSVMPRFIFVRHSDLAQVILDVGTLPLSERSVMKITLEGRSVPWVEECPPIVVPAASILSPCFCASAGASGKRLTEEEARLASHGILPAQPRRHIQQPGQQP